MDFSALNDGGPIQTVNPEDLRSVWDLMQETHAKVLANCESKLDSAQLAIAVDAKLLVQVCSPQANVMAVWARSALLGVLAQQGLLSSWPRGTQLADAVFDAAADFPISALDQLDPEAFLEQLRSRGV